MTTSSDLPSAAFEQLIDGYHRFRQNGWTPNRQRWEALGEGQQPEVMIIACSDSRVDPSQIFDVDPGEIFVVRNVAALVPPFETTPGHHGVSAALEFAVQVLKVKEIIVMGHGKCGGCKAALNQSLRGMELGNGGFVSDWISLLDDAREAVAETLGTEGADAERGMELAAVRVSLENLMTFPCIRSKVGKGRLKIRGAFFAIADGMLHVLDEETDEFHRAASYKKRAPNNRRPFL